jgi:hypothetical protein
MYGPLTSDLVNAAMADRHREAARLGLEQSWKRSQPSRRRSIRSGESITAMLGTTLAAARALLMRPRPSTSAY